MKPDTAVFAHNGPALLKRLRDRGRHEMLIRRWREEAKELEDRLRQLG
jgi:hypothetical protein